MTKSVSKLPWISSDTPASNCSLLSVISYQGMLESPILWQQFLTNQANFIYCSSHNGELALEAFDWIDLDSFDFGRCKETSH